MNVLIQKAPPQRGAFCILYGPDYRRCLMPKTTIDAFICGPFVAVNEIAIKNV